MDPDLSWSEVLIRLVACLAASAILGLNRGQHGRPAGIRTTVLVSLTACASLILANLLMNTHGRPPDSYVTMDIMRLPLGVLTGVGFIGAGAILRRGKMVLGVTTAATLWFATMMGFYFGAGEMVLGGVLFLLGIFVLWGLDWIEDRLPTKRTASLVVKIAQDGPPREQIVGLASSAHYHLAKLSLKMQENGQELRYLVHWREVPHGANVPSFVDQLASLPGVLGVEWDEADQP